MKRRARFCILLLLCLGPSWLMAADDGERSDGFWSAVEWKFRAGLTNFRVEDSNTLGLGYGVKGRYATAGGTDMELVVTLIADYDQDELDPDHIPVWFKNWFKAEKPVATLSPSWTMLATLDIDHRMNTVGSLEQSLVLGPGLKFRYATSAVELFARLGAGGYYLEIDDDLPGLYSDYRREDLANATFAVFQEYKASLTFADAFSVICRYKDMRDTSGESLEWHEEIELDYAISPRTKLVLDAEKTHYNLDQFSRSAGDNGLAVLPFDEDTFYQAYVEFDF